ncbi:MAG: hypothetical protein IJT43_00430 [Stomatobaculum sp.]|nr:hypothetical protein [Stomatobaculum sp.]
MKKIFALVTAIATAASLAACGGSSSGGSSTTAAPAAETTQASTEMVVSKADDVVVEHDKPIQVTVALTNSVAMMSPIMVTNPYNHIVGAGVYERLAEREQFGSENFRGVLLKEWNEERSGEGEEEVVTYHCELYDYITDAAGNKLTAEDVKYFSEIQGTDGKKIPPRFVDRVDVTGDYTFDVVFQPGKYYAGLWTEYCEGMFIATRASYEKSVADNSICVGTGPYVCTDFMSNSYAVMEKRDDYWQTPELTTITSRANVDKIRYNIVSEVTQMAIALDSPQDTQMAANVTESLVADAEAKAEQNGTTITRIPTAQTKIFAFNCTENSVMQNEDFRKAICYAINNEGLINAVFAGIGFPVATLGVPSLEDYDKAWEAEPYYPYDYDKACEHFKAAGYDPNNVGVKITFMATQTALSNNTGAYLAGCLAPFGIEVDVQCWEAAASNTYKFDMASGWDIYEVGETPSKTFNYLYWANFGDEPSFGGHAVWGESSDELRSLIAKVKSGDADAWKTYRDRLVNEALLYQYGGVYFTISHVKPITNIVTDWRNSLVVGACTFSEDYNYYVE